jgi:hypothetical protein
MLYVNNIFKSFSSLLKPNFFLNLLVYNRRIILFGSECVVNSHKKSSFHVSFTYIPYFINIIQEVHKITI